MIHKEVVYISKEELKKANYLLSINSLEELSDAQLQEIGAETDVCVGLFYIEFDNGATMNIDLCSGQHNYYDDVVWTSPDGSRDVVFDCEYNIDNIEVEIDGELYIVEIEQYDSSIIVNNGKNIKMSSLASCIEYADWTLNDCEHKCPKYSSCDTVAMANDILKSYEGRGVI
jgi:hypothetical protein